MATKTLTDVSEMQQAIRDLAESVGGELYNGYSGRGMYGAECLGIDCEDDKDVIERCREYRLPRPKVDNLGVGYICYWGVGSGTRGRVRRETTG